MTYTFTDRADPDEMAHDEPSDQELHCLPFCFGFCLKPHLTTIDQLTNPILTMETSTVAIHELKG